LHDQWKESIIVPIHKKSDKTDCNNYYGISLLSTSYKIDEIIGDSVGFDVIDQLLIKFSAFARYRRKNGSTMEQYISYS
jgi:hypothetical protein